MTRQRCEKEFKRKKECVNCAHIISMSEMEDIADMEFGELLVGLDKLDSELYVVILHTDGQDMLEELLGGCLSSHAKYVGDGTP